MDNGIILQAFEWELPDDGNHYNFLKENLDYFLSHGINALWLPPVTKATGTNDVGYGIYDLFDLGEFDQKGNIRTKYGTKEELHRLIDTAHEKGIRIYADVVLNHKAGADESEIFKAVQVNQDNREEEIGEAHDIEAWTKFTFPGRKGKYSEFVWTHDHFSGVDFDQKSGQTGIFKIVGENKGWSWSVADEHGNFDYLMFADIDHNHPDVRAEIFYWVKWFIEETKVDGFRWDASKHIDANFMDELNEYIISDIKGDFYSMAEYWKTDEQELNRYIEETSQNIDLFDVILHYNFQEASKAGADYDLRTLFDNSIVQSRPTLAVTFVDNHDSQPGQSLESWVEPWFKSHAYASILLRDTGYPVVFFGDLYGLGDGQFDGLKDELDKLMMLRKDYAYGKQDDYMHSENTIGWVRHGDDNHPGSLAVVMTNGDMDTLSMFVGEDQEGKTFIDYLRHNEAEVVINEDGFGDFPVSPGSVSAYVEKFD